ncbi:MAG: thioesterase domain-containing protein [Peptococcaceae bacterium]|nr:thioesterase domain-containing protein [Peptococcaceae bacterium]
MLDNRIAIIGVSGRYSGAPSPKELWENLLTEKDFSFYREGCPNWEAPAQKRDVNVYSKVEDIELFDAEFFHMTPYETQITDPQQRLLLELGFEALTDAGYARIDRKQCIGVFAAISMSSYLLNNVLRNKRYFSGDFDYNLLIGNDKDYAATKIAYKLNLSGPAYSIQSACSSSLVALHNACQSLLNYECDAALVGAVSLSIPQANGYTYQEGGIMSPTGYCKPFDDEANGIVKGNGGSVVMIKRLTDAVQEGDAIYAVISGTAINNDGSHKIGFTAPSSEGQRDVIRECLEFSGLHGSDIDYIEAHGTGTHLGDPIEIKALSEVYRGITKKIPVGSIKAKIGHLDVAAGLASVIKAVYMLNTGIVPGNTHFRRLNHAISIPDDNFYFPVSPENKNLNNIGVSSFGLGGTNAHIILSKYDETAAGQSSWEIKKAHRMYMVPLSYLRESDQEGYLDSLADYLEHSEVPLQDFVYTMSVGVPVLKNRGYVLCHNKKELAAKLRSKTIKTAQDPATIPVFHLDAYREFAATFVGYDELCRSYMKPLKDPDEKDLTPHEEDPNLAETDNAEYTARHNAWMKWISRVLQCDEASLNEKAAGLYQNEAALDKAALNQGDVCAGNPLEIFLSFLGAYWTRNTVDFGVLYNSLGWKRTHMPKHPLRKKKYWIDPDPEVSAPGATGTASESKPLDKVSEPSPSDRVSSDRVLSDILFIWSDVLGLEDILPDDDFYDIGGDSLLLLSILEDINKKWNVSIAFNDLVNLNTPRMIANHLQEIKEPKHEYPILSRIRQATEPRPNEPHINLFLFHPAGGTTFCYKQLSHCISPKVDINIYGIDLPDNYHDYPTMCDLASLYMKALLSVQSAGIFYLGGYSFGGNMACEVASQLQKAGYTTAKVILFDSHPPEAYNTYSGQVIDYQEVFPIVIANYLQLDTDFVQELYAIKDSDKAVGIIQDRMGGDLPMTKHEINEFYQKWVYSHELLKSHFLPQKIQADCMFYKGDIPENEFILQVLHIDYLPKETWEHYFAGELRIVETPGTHYTMFGDGNNIKCLAALMEDYFMKL